MKHETYTCDRCGGSIGNSEKRDRLRWEEFQGDVLLNIAYRRADGSDGDAPDLCSSCCRSLAEWWAGGKEPGQ